MNTMTQEDYLKQLSQAELINQIIDLKQKLIIKENKIIDLLQTVEDVRFFLNKLIINTYGTKSEKKLPTSDPETADFENNQPGLTNTEACFDEAKDLSAQEQADIIAAEEIITVAAHTRTKKSNKNKSKPGRKPLPEQLPRIVITHDIPDADKICHCGCALTQITSEKTERLDIIPAKLQVIVDERLKYACRACEDIILTAPVPQYLIPRSIASAGTLAYVAVAKYEDHLPLYRQENIFKRLGIDIVRNTLSNWIIKIGERLEPLYNLLIKNITSYDVAAADETEVQVLKEKERAAESKSFMWCFSGGKPDQECIIFHYDQSRATCVIEEILTNDYQGYLHCDGYIGYDCYCKRNKKTKQVGCWMHARRPFANILKAAPNNPDSIASRMINLIGKLYDVEAKIKGLGITSPDEIKKYRNKHSKPIIAKIKAFVDDKIKTTLPQSAIGKALAYVRNQWLKLIVYLEDGRLKIDNGFSERCIKSFVIGRKNWLFCNSVAGAKASKIIFSIISTAKLHGLESYAYLKYLFEEIPKITSDEQYYTLLPYNIKKEINSELFIKDSTSSD